MRNAVNQLASPGAGQVVDEESLVSQVLRGVARDQRYAATVTSIRLAAAPPNLLQLKASLKRTYMAIKAEPGLGKQLMPRICSANAASALTLAVGRRSTS
eukprot:1481206-Rhodomonas_salina.1